MTRSIHADVITELAKDDFNYADLLRFDFSAGYQYLNTSNYTITYDSNDYDPADITSISSLSESSELMVGTLNIELGGANQTYISLFFNNDYVGVRARWYRAILDDAMAVIGDPILMFDGEISGWKGGDSKSKSSLTITCASHWANFDTISGRKTNQNSQQAHFASDLGMEYASHTIRDIRWGRGNG